ncbi:hypothetical protein [Flavobacterium sp.]|jgi:hypothetical protein|uniref:hypothetical protein n=1 Tax=Flavobacterium sp. TaxID=239 RepID=UPI0037C07E9E
MSKKFNFVKYEYGVIHAQSEKEATQNLMMSIPSNESVTLIAVSKESESVFIDLLMKEDQNTVQLKKVLLWKESDLETIALELEKQEGKKLFNRNRFFICLCEMIKNYNVVDGITLQTVQTYLRIFCLIK